MQIFTQYKYTLMHMCAQRHRHKRNAQTQVYSYMHTSTYMQVPIIWNDTKSLWAQDVSIFYKGMEYEVSLAKCTSAFKRKKIEKSKGE